MQIKVERAGDRLDLFMLAHFAGVHTRAQITNFIKDEQILVNDNCVKCGYMLKVGDVITGDIIKRESNAIAENIPLDIVFEDEYLIVVNKPYGMVVHAGAGVHSGTLVNALLGRKAVLSTGSDKMRPGIVHRLDKNTSGLLIVAKTDNAHAQLANMFEKHEVERVYWAICEGVFKNDEGTIKTRIGRNPNKRTEYMVVPIGGKLAITHYKVLKRFSKNTLVEFKLETGRTHQIRVHSKHLNNPIVGDDTYGRLPRNSHNATEMMLCSKKLTFIHPFTKKQMQFEIELPKSFDYQLQKL